MRPHQVRPSQENQVNQWTKIDKKHLCRYYGCAYMKICENPKNDADGKKKQKERKKNQKRLCLFTCPVYFCLKITYLGLIKCNTHTHTTKLYPHAQTYTHT